MQRPTTLGRVLRYFADARRFADESGKAQSSNGPTYSSLLGDMAHVGAWQMGDTLDTEQSRRLAVCSAWVYSDIKLIADRAASRDAMPTVKRRVGEELHEERNHPFEVLLARPNDLHAGGVLIRTLIWWLCLHGNAYVFLGTPSPGQGEIMELMPLPANMVTPLPATLRKSTLTKRLTIDYEYTIGGHPTLLPGENVVHFALSNVFDYWQGLSPLSAALLGMQTDWAQARWVRDWFGKDNAIPTAIISLPPETTTLDFDAAREQIRHDFGEQRKSAIIRAGDMSVQTITQTLEQMQMIASRQFNRDEIDRVFGIPQGLVSGGLSGDSRLAAEITFARNVIQPLIDFMADIWTLKVGPYYGDDIVIEAPNVIPQDRALEVQEYSVYSQDMTVNENREARGLEAINLPIAKVPVRLLQYIQSPEPPPEPEPTPQPEALAAPVVPQAEVIAQPGAPNETPTEAEPTGTQGIAGAPAPAALVEAQAGKAAMLGVETEIKRWERVALKEYRDGRDPAERPFESEIIPEDLRLCIKMALECATTEEGVKLSFAPPFAVKAIVRTTADGKRDPNAAAKDKDEARLVRLLKVNLDEHLTRITGALGDPPDLNKLDAEFWSQEEKEIIAALRPEIERMALAGAKTLYDTIPVGFDWALIAEGAAKFAETYSFSLVRGINDHSRAVLQRKVKQYVETPSMMMGELRKGLEPTFGETRAESIAVTEVTRAYAQGEMAVVEEAKEVGLDMETIWHTNRDELVCPVCQPRDGKPMDEWDTPEIPPIHPRDRCWITHEWKV